MSKTNPQQPGGLHYLRPAAKAAHRRQMSRLRSKAPAKGYPPGYFTAPVRAWKGMGWQAGYWPQRAAEWQRAQSPSAPTLNQGRSSEHMTAERERRAAQGLGWGHATLNLPGTPSWRANPLEWMNRDLGGKPMR